jgi:uncharacterized Zn finger protein
MPRETVAAKATRYLAEGRVTIFHVAGDHVAAEVAGDTGTWRCGRNPKRPGGWWCACPAKPGRCAHVAALKLVTVRRCAAERAA